MILGVFDPEHLNGRGPVRLDFPDFDTTLWGGVPHSSSTPSFRVIRFTVRGPDEPTHRLAGHAVASRLHQASHAPRSSSESVELQFSGTGANMEFDAMQSPDPTLAGGTENALCVASMRNSPNKIALGC